MNDILTRLQAANPALGILPVSDPSFARYGRVLDGLDASEIIARAQAILPASEKVVYEPSVAALEAPCAFSTAVQRAVFGGMPVQVGWCYGRNLRMGALEYHKGIEVNVCLTDVVLLVGDLRDVQFGEAITYDTRQVAAYYAPAGAVLEFHTWNLHFAPIHAQQATGFATLVYLPRGANEPLPFAVGKRGEARLLLAVNKWLIAHPGAADLVARGAYAGLAGDDIVVTPA
jgi:hypothetical protein